MNYFSFDYDTCCGEYEVKGRYRIIGTSLPDVHDRGDVRFKAIDYIEIDEVVNKRTSRRIPIQKLPLKIFRDIYDMVEDWVKDQLW